MSTLNQLKRWIRILGTSLALILVVAGASKVSAQEIYLLSANLSHGYAPTKSVRMDSTMAVPKREPLVESMGIPDLQASMLDRPSIPESGAVKETRESVLEQVAALGSAFGRSLKSASSRCTGWQGGGFEQHSMGPDSTLNRACVFQFELPTN